MNFAEYVKKQVPDVKKAPKIPDPGGWWSENVWHPKNCDCHKRIMWLNGVFARAYMFAHKTIKRAKNACKSTKRPN